MDGTSSRGWRRIVCYALLSRMIFLFGMVLSSICIPDLDTGAGVHRFDLRLEEGDSCFCLVGHACDIGGGPVHSPPSGSCASPLQYETRVTREVYRIILTPLTRWDAARFLTLAVDPNSRVPRQKIADIDIDAEPNLAPQCLATKNASSGDCPDGTTPKKQENAFVMSEQAHAFFPLVPLCIRSIANLMKAKLPCWVLPPTYEATAALAALCLNIVAFTIAALALYLMTFYLTLSHCLDRRCNISRCERVAQMSALLFCINPAGVFFTAAYSESIFSMLTFTGHAIIASAPNMTYTPIRLLIAALLWSIASYGRSNGTLSAVWLAITGLSRIIHLWTDTSIDSKSFGKAVLHTIYIFAFHGILVSVVAFPVYYHDRCGYTIHCIGASPDHRPDWCMEEADNNSFFSLYGYVQRKHWNVGFLRYFEWKQAPNFLLATPILMLGAFATKRWIQHSWTVYHESCSNQSRLSPIASNLKSHPKGQMDHVLTFLFGLPLWVPYALRNSNLSCVPEAEIPKGSAQLARNKGREVQTDIDVPSLTLLLCGPHLLAYYAILSGLCLVGLFVAHVQVSTRLICSTCPAIYWYMALEVEGNRVHWKKSIVGYCIIFNILGIIMHPNWLPWT
eukprot:CAMPEP_0198290956 /NCGR_PEP_ID=MMETSP1449-20131203/8637_1 /TAXON_ID=420275 /ORGANISM="Attheya septentrionalis, Strain CCMP2084" /LENGTH=620 /DNA_ID=CAMNT_0043989525 /DNA_START=87 /DNA_END=1949 /DNA_ORIENTATION=+